MSSLPVYKTSFLTWLHISDSHVHSSYADAWHYLHGWPHSVDDSPIIRLRRTIDDRTIGSDEILSTFEQDGASSSAARQLQWLLWLWGGPNRIMIDDREDANRRENISPTLRFSILKRDGFRCRYCGQDASDGIKLEIDHILPVSKGGETVESNLQTTCFSCNRGKRDRLI